MLFSYQHMGSVCYLVMAFLSMRVGQCSGCLTVLDVVAYRLTYYDAAS